MGGTALLAGRIPVHSTQRLLWTGDEGCICGVATIHPLSVVDLAVAFTTGAVSSPLCQAAGILKSRDLDVFFVVD